MLGILVVLWALTPIATLADSGRSQTVTQRQSVSVSGVVVDPSGAILPGATVDLLDAQGAALQTTAADAGAAFHFDHVPPGTVPDPRVILGPEDIDGASPRWRASPVPREDRDGVADGRGHHLGR